MTESPQEVADRLLAGSNSGKAARGIPARKVTPSKPARSAVPSRPPRGPGEQFTDHPDLALALQRKKMLAELSEQNNMMIPVFPTRTGANSATIRITDPRLAGTDLVNFSTYDYLGLNNHPRVIEASAQATEQYGTSASASRAVSGQTPLHLQLERQLADIFDVGDAMVTPSGYLTNAATIGFLLKPGDVVVCDEFIHTSVVAGVQWSGARRLTFRHNDPESLRSVLRASRNTFDRALVVLEGHYSMDGTVGRVAEAVDVARTYDCAVMVDEAHSFGVFGAHGHGIREHYGMPGDAVDIWMGTLSKALAGSGGYIAGSTKLIEAIKYSATAFTATGSSTPASLGAAQAALDVMHDEPRRLTRLWANAEQFHTLLTERGLDLGMSEGTPICPVIVSGELRSGFVSSTLLQQGVYAAFITAPTIPAGQERIRFFLTSEHTPEQLLSTADLVAKTVAQAKEIPDPTADT
ncbi:aminotransferase class I/II-fold pyridoxal phosphate-dependent enzyme [Nocardia sp. 004]|uniref:aminotransferase class I/II-fold pyridoxal phosphate-dependent enzyme n=1 Tax=Nocardia sp. 004 TaxID=3385978 RepID=UPI0039A2BDFF